MTEFVRKHGARLTSRKFIIMCCASMVVSYIAVYAVHTKQETVTVVALGILGGLIQSFNHYNIKGKGLTDDKKV